MEYGIAGFNGERIDPVSGHYHPGNGYRAYSPVLMRFTCPDSMSPFGDGGINPYAYCAGDPVNHADPTGHLSWQAWLGIGMGIAGLGLGLALFTGGASIAAAVAAAAAESTAIESASAASLAIGAAGVASDVTAIASGAAEESNPRASAILGWVSLGTGIVGLGAGVYGAGIVGYRGLNKLASAFSKGLSPAGESVARAAGAMKTEGGVNNSSWSEYFTSLIYGHKPEISEPKDLRLFEDNLPRFESDRNTPRELGYEMVKIQRLRNQFRIRTTEINSPEELNKFIVSGDDWGFKFILSEENKLVVGLAGNDAYMDMTHQALANLHGIKGPVKTAGTIERVGNYFRVTNASGHYRPSPDSLKHMEVLFASWGELPELIGFVPRV